MPDANTEIVEGGRYEMEVKSADRSKLSYIGEVKDVDDSYVVFDGAVKRAEVESSPPFPILNKFFVNKAVGMEEVKEKVRIRRDDIVGVLLLDEPLNDQPLNEQPSYTLAEQAMDGTIELVPEEMVSDQIKNDSTGSHRVLSDLE